MVKLVGKNDLLNSISTEEVKSPVLIHVLNDLFNNPDLSGLDIKWKINKFKHSHEKYEFGGVFHADCQYIIYHTIHVMDRGVHYISRVHVFI